jgi:hypothetical protein
MTALRTPESSEGPLALWVSEKDHQAVVWDWFPSPAEDIAVLMEWILDFS